MEETSGPFLLFVHAQKIQITAMIKIFFFSTLPILLVLQFMIAYIPPAAPAINDTY